MLYKTGRALSQAIIKLMVFSLVAATLAGLIPPPLVASLLPQPAAELAAALLPDTPAAHAVPLAEPAEAPLLNAPNAPIPGANSGQIRGIVFRDFNTNGVMNTTGDTTNPAIDSGVVGITVIAYNAAGAQVGATATTAADGSYTISSLIDGDPYRVEFSTLPAGYESSLYNNGVGVTSDTSVQFVTGGTGNVSFAINQPCDYCQPNPVLATSQYYKGEKTGQANKNTIVGFPYNAGSSTAVGYNNPTTPLFGTRLGSVGTTWGLGYARSRQQVYAAAFFKRHTAFGPGADGIQNNADDPGAIYVIDRNTGQVVTTFSVAGVTTNAHNVANYDSDNGNMGWDAVGKTALGGLDLSDDDLTLYVMDVQNRRLVALNAVTGVQIAAVNVPTTGVPTPVIPGSVTPTNATCASSDVRPFAVEFYHAALYFGMVCSAESTGNVNDLWAYVYSADPTTLAISAAPVFSTPLNYSRGQANYSQAADWNPWTPTYRVVGGLNASPVYPQPMLTGLTFDMGSMVLGLRDRFADQVGNGSLSQQGATNRPTGIQAGDILQVCQNSGGPWTLEANGLCNGRGTSDNPNNSAGQGPGNGELYYEDDFSTPHNSAAPHDEVSSAGVVQVPGFPNVAVTAFDPIPRQVLYLAHSGGVRWFNNRTGALQRFYLIYSSGSGTFTNQFGKSNGLGDLVVLCDAAPLEIGNRVWLDANDNGLQDADEAVIANVAVRLTNAAGTSFTSVTGSNGEYHFNGSNVTGGIQPNSPYTLTIETTQPALVNYVLTIPNAPSGSSLPDSVDSDATLVGALARIALTTGAAGQNDDSLDFGFAPNVFSLGNRLWYDTNNDGLDNDGTSGGLGAGISGLSVQLLNASSVLIATTTSDANGYYRFDGLSAGVYSVVLPASNFASGGDLENYQNSTATANDSVDANDNGNLNGSLGSGGDVRTAAITLAAGTLPMGEVASGGGVNGPNGDALDDLTVDFGFYKLTLGSRVWLDDNRDGLDGVETGAVGIPVTLTTGAAVFVAATTTDASGDYTFTNLVSGDYIVQIEAPTYFVSTLPNDTTVNSDLNDNGQGNATGVISSQVFALTPGVASGDITVNQPSGHTRNPTIDFGLYQPSADLRVVKSVNPPIYTLGVATPVTFTVVITNYGPDLLINAPVTDTQPVNVAFTSWNCVIHNGGPGDGCGAASGIGNLQSTVSLHPNASALYIIHATISSAATGDVGNTVSEALPLGILQDSANRQDSATAIVVPTQPLFSVGNRVWLDTNDDGVFNGAEVGTPDIFGVFMQLVNDSGQVVQTTYTGANGYYRFDNVAAGTYEIVVGSSNFEIPGTAGYRNSSGVITTTTNVTSGVALANFDNHDHGLNSFADTTVNGVHSVPFRLGLGLQPTGEAAGSGGGADGPHGDDRSNLTIDFGFNRQHLGNQLWYDVDNNGVFDGGEATLPAGVILTLNAVAFGVDAGVFYTTTTDANGQYDFSAANNVDLDLTDVFVYVAIPPGQPALNSYLPSTGLRHVGGGVDNENTGAINASGVVTSGLFIPLPGSTANGAMVSDPEARTYQPTIDFGFVLETYTLGNRVWLDTNDNGLFDAAEQTPPSVFLELRNSSGDIISTTLTNASGHYSFTNLPAGTYDVVVAASNFVGLGAGYQNSTNTTAPSANLADDNRDHGFNVTQPGVDSIHSGYITLGPGLQPVGEGDGAHGPEGDANDNMTIDFGFYKMSVGNLVWDDRNNDGLYDSATEFGVPGVRMRIYASNGMTQSEIPVGPDGAWGTADDALGGIRTDNNGIFTVTGLISGTYIIEIDLPDGYVSSTGIINASQVGPYEPPPDPDNNLDHDDNGYYEILPSRVTHSYPVTLRPGYSGAAGNTLVLDLAGGTTDDTVDFGIFHDMVLGNLVWNDLNNDGLWDDGVESGLDGVQVNLYFDANGDGDVADTGETTPISTTVTTGGLYLFTFLPPGNYLVELAAGNFNAGGLLASYASSTGLNGGVSGPYEGAPDPDAAGVDNDDNGSLSGVLGSGGSIRSTVFNLEEGDEPTNEYPDNEPFRLDTNENLTVDFGVLRYASLGDYTWIDVDKNGVQDGGEPPLPGVTVELLDVVGASVAGTTSDASGLYTFTLLAPGNYSLEFTPPTAYLITQQDQGGNDALDSDGDRITNQTIQTNLLLDARDRTWDAGFAALAMDGDPTLNIPLAMINVMADSTFKLPIDFVDAAITNDISALTFSLDFDASCLTFDNITDSDEDGIPDAVTDLPSGYLATMTYDAADTDGEIDLAILDQTVPQNALPDARLVTFEFGVLPSCRTIDSTPADGNLVPQSFTFATDPAPTFAYVLGGAVAGGAHVQGERTLRFNATPTALALTANTINENGALGSAVGTLSSTDFDLGQTPGDSHIYSLVAGPGDSDNSSFAIVGAALTSNGSLDFETKPAYAVLLRTTDSYAGTFDQAFTINVVDVNEAPTTLTINGRSVNENAASGTTVGIFSAADVDAADANEANKTYSLVTGGVGALDNAFFTIVGSNLQTAASFNYEAKKTYNVYVRVTDIGGLTFDNIYTIVVDDINDAPVAAADVVDPHRQVILVPTELAVLANDTDEDRLPTANTLIIVPDTISPPTSGTAVANPDNLSILYTPAAGFNGPISFTYTINDGTVDSVVAANVTLQVVANDIRGDCNHDGPTNAVNAGDFPAFVLELYDTDSTTDWYNTYTGSFVGSPLGCDANVSQSVTIADLVCAILVSFGNSTCTTLTVQAASTLADAELTVGQQPIDVRNSTVNVLVGLTTNGHRVAAASFALSFDKDQLAFDATDADQNGLPDAVTFNTPPGMVTVANYNAAAHRLELTVYAVSLPMPTLADGLVANVRLQVNEQATVAATPIALLQSSLGSDQGQAVPVAVSDGAVQIVQARLLFLPLISR